MSLNSNYESSTVTNASSGVSNTVAKGSNEEAKAVFKTGSVYQGVITSCQHADQVYNVQLGGQGGPVQRCEWGVGICASLLGFKTSMLPTVGTNVVVLGGKPPVIIGTIPADPRDDITGKTRLMSGTAVEELADLKEGELGSGVRHSIPSDLVEGEFAIENQMGVALQFLTNLISLKGSERAKVETHLLNDMVRIVSDTFKHMSCFGDYEIYNDGGLNVRFEGTSREHEAQGLLKPDAPRVKVDSNEVEMDADLVENARFRFSKYVGFLGDFIHVFVTDPSTLASNIGDSLRAGKSRFWQGMDGTCLLQSVTEISIERVVRIPVPQEKKRWDDPEGILKTSWKNMIKAQKGFTEVWNYGENYKDIYKATFQLREYARWMNCYHSYARFHQYAAEGEEWHVPKETDVRHEWTNKEEDVEDANSHLKPAHYDTYACIRIMRDGAILLWDGYGSSITMTRGMVQVSATRHLELEAGGDIRLIAGNDIYIRGRRNVEIVATVGALVTKARTAWKALCEWGSVWIKSDAQDPKAASFSAPTPDNESEDPEPEIHDAAILLDTSKGCVTVNSARTLTLQIDGSEQPDNSADHTDVSKSVVIQSQLQDVRLYSSRNTFLKTTGTNEGCIALDCTTSAIVLTTKYLLSDCRILDINNNFTLSNGILNVRTIRANTVAAKDALYGRENTLAYIDTETKCCYVPHGNHVLTATEDQEPEFADPEIRSVLEDYVSEVKPNFRYNSAFSGDTDPVNGPEWRMYAPEQNNYDWLYGSKKEERFVSLAQQRIDYDTLINPLYDEWVLANDTLKEAPRTQSQDVPYPGKAKKELMHDTDIDPLHKPFDGEYSEQSPSIKTDLTSRDVKRYFLKPSSNK